MIKIEYAGNFEVSKGLYEFCQIRIFDNINEQYPLFFEVPKDEVIKLRDDLNKLLKEE
jgi:hypothetical protein